MSKASELREQTDEQLELHMAETQKNLFRLRLQSETERLFEAPSENHQGQAARSPASRRSSASREIERASSRSPPRKPIPTSQRDEPNRTPR